MSKVRIEIEGGFHNCGPIRIDVPLETAQTLIESGYSRYLVSKRQERKIRMHFCGMSSCTCGDAARDTSIMMVKQ